MADQRDVFLYMKDGDRNTSTESIMERLPSFGEDKFVYATLLALILIVANTINGFTVAVFLKNRLLHTANNFLVVSLAVSDWLHVISGCLVPLLWFVNEGGSMLHNSYILCRAVGYGTHIFYSMSTNNLVLISFHRLVSIVFSQRKIIATMKSAQRAIVGLWFFTAATCLPGLFRDGTYHFNPTLKTCTILAQYNTDPVFGTYSLALNFLFPFFLMCFFYLKIYKMVLHHKLSTVSETILTSGVIEKKSKRLIMSVLGIFCTTWTPFYTTLIISSFSTHEIPSTALVLIWPLKMSSSMSNPILYAVCNRLYFRCMMRLMKCRGPLLNKQRLSPLSILTHRPSCYSSSNDLKEEEISTIAPLPDHICDHCIHCREPLLTRKQHYASLVNNCTQTSRFSEEQEPPTSVTMGCRHSTCSHCTEISTSLSTRSSVPTIFQMPIQRFKRRGSNGSSTSTHVFGPTPEGQFYPDSGRSSFASQYGATPSMHSARTSYSSNWPNSNRTSLNSNYAHFGSTPRGSTATDFDMKRLPSFSSRQSFYSSLSMPRSTRSSVVSSRISHYAPMSSFSARSSLTSQYTYGSTPFSTRPNTPQDLVLNTDVEWVCGPRERDGSSQAKSSSTPSTRHSSDTTLTSEKLGCRQIPDQSLDIFEDEEPPPSGASSQMRRSPRSAASPCPSPPELDIPSPDNTCQRVSMFLLGDFDPDSELLDPEIKSKDVDKLRKKKKRVVQKIVVAQASSAYSPSPPSKGYHSDTSPYQGRRVKSVSPRIPTPRSPSPSPPRERACRHNCEKDTSPTPDGDALARRSHQCHKQDDISHFINTVGKAVNVVVKARRLRSKVQPSVRPIKPDTPVPEHLTAQVQRVPHVREPIRFVYETFYPSTYYSSYGPNPMSATKNTLRVPGRPPPLNVPQTIQEEETPVDPLPPLPETPATPRRKNASSWIAPPVIDVAHGDEDMRVECPGVLVEHHN